MSYAYFTQEEIWRHTQSVSKVFDELGDSVERNMRAGSLWNDRTTRELVENVRNEANRILADQTDYLLYPNGTLETDLTDALNAYDETVAILEGVKR